MPFRRASCLIFTQNTEQHDPAWDYTLMTKFERIRQVLRDGQRLDADLNPVPSSYFDAGDAGVLIRIRIQILP